MSNSTFSDMAAINIAKYRGWRETSQKRSVSPISRQDRKKLEGSHHRRLATEVQESYKELQTLD